MKYYYFIRYDYSASKDHTRFEYPEDHKGSKSTIYISNKPILSNEDLNDANNKIKEAIRADLGNSRGGKWFCGTDITSMNFLYERED